jgi:hypothetical protein
MKRFTSALLMVCLLLTLVACGKEPEPADTTAAIDVIVIPEDTTVPDTTAAPETTSAPETTAAPVIEYRNPLNGQPLEEPISTRFFATTINNVGAALPHKGVSQADIFFEMFVNDYCTRGLAVFSDVSQVSDIGSIRSHRYPFTDLALSYDLIVANANGSEAVIADMKQSGIDYIRCEIDAQTVGYSYRDKDRRSSGYSFEHTLFVRGPKLVEAAQSLGYEVTQDGTRDYGMIFSEEAAISGVAAKKITITFRLHDRTKDTVMTYDPETDGYVFSQYGETMVDFNNNEQEDFTNVFMILAETHNEGSYHLPDILGTGDGYYAYGGQMIPIKWQRETDNDPFRFTLEDGTPLTQAVGNNYIAIAPTESSVTAE